MATYIGEVVDPRVYVVEIQVEDGLEGEALLDALQGSDWEEAAKGDPRSAHHDEESYMRWASKVDPGTGDLVGDGIYFS